MTLEQNFLDYVKQVSPIYGVFGMSSAERDLKFLILDEYFKVTYQRDPYVKGSYPPVIEKKIDTIKKIRAINDDFDGRTRTDNNVEDLICHLYTSSCLKLIGKKIYVTDESDEFRNFDFVCEAYGYTRKHGIFSDGISYESFTDKGKKSIDEAKEFLDKNTSLTPVQDAFNKVLEKNGLPTHEPFVKWCEFPVMHPIDYSSKEELARKREEKYGSFNTEVRAELKKILNRMEGKK